MPNYEALRGYQLNPEKFIIFMHTLREDTEGQFDVGKLVSKYIGWRIQSGRGVPDIICRTSEPDGFDIVDIFFPTSSDRCQNQEQLEDLIRAGKPTEKDEMVLSGWLEYINRDKPKQKLISADMFKFEVMNKRHPY